MGLVNKFGLLIFFSNRLFVEKILISLFFELIIMMFLLVFSDRLDGLER